jgi:mycofactocin glycosyltransferase
MTVPAVRIEASVRRRGRVLIGGVPVRLLRLSEVGVSVYDRLNAGETPWSPGSEALARRLLEASMAQPIIGPVSVGRRDVAVVIPVYEDASGLRTLLTSDAMAGVDEVIVVDDGSPNADSASTAREHSAKTIIRPTSGGPGVAREAGWRVASAEFIAFVDADCLPPPGWLDGLLGHFGDDDVVAVAPRVAGVHDTVAGGGTLLERYEVDHGPIDRGVAPARVGVGAVPFVPTAALVVRRSALEAVKGFNETLRVGEDVDLVWRLLEIGTVRYEPSVVVSHRSRPGMQSWLRQRFRYGQSAATLDELHPGRLAAVDLHAWSAVSWGFIVVAKRRGKLAGVGASALSSGLLARRLSGTVEQPIRTAVELAGLGNFRSSHWMARAARREWWPVALGAAVVSRRLRPAVTSAFLVGPLVREFRASPKVGIVKAVGIGLADDMAYGAGVWAGCWKQRRLGPILPKVRLPGSR